MTDAKPVHRVAVVGSRSFPDLDLVAAFVRSLPTGTTVRSGGARGVDETAARVARSLGLTVMEILVDTLYLPQDPRARRFEYARRAYTRNRIIIEGADAVVAFWDGQSGGTKNSIKWARKLDKPLCVIAPKGMDPAKLNVPPPRKGAMRVIR